MRNPGPENGMVAGNGTSGQNVCQGVPRKFLRQRGAERRRGGRAQPGLDDVLDSNFLPSRSGTGATLAQLCFGATAR
jgi:hypothetical protein